MASWCSIVAGPAGDARGIARDLDGKEFRILQLLLEHGGRVLSREQLEKNLYSWGDEVESNAVQVHIHHLRKKLGRDLIRTVHAIGYCIDKPKVD